MKRLAYLNLQRAVEGQASYAHVHEIIKGLRARGFTVDLFEPSIPPGSGVLSKASAAVCAQLRLISKAGCYDATYIRYHPLAFPAAAVMRALRIPVIQENNGPYNDMYIAYPWTRRLSRLLELISDLQFRWANALITVTPQLAAWLKTRSGHSNIQVIPNGANTHLFHPAARSTRGLPQRYVFFFGAMAAWQGVDSLLAAVDDPVWPVGVKLVIAGDGAERKKVEKFASRSDKLIYLGFVPYGDIPGILACSLAGISPQSDFAGRAETGLSPLKVFETMACGVPVILSNFPGVADLVQAAEAGISIQPSDPAALAAAVCRIATDESLRRRMGSNGRRIMESEHSWDVRAESTARVITAAIAGAECAGTARTVS